MDACSIGTRRPLTETIMRRRVESLTFPSERANRVREVGVARETPVGLLGGRKLDVERAAAAGPEHVAHRGERGRGLREQIRGQTIRFRLERSRGHGATRES